MYNNNQNITTVEVNTHDSEMCNSKHTVFETSYNITS